MLKGMTEVRMVQTSDGKLFPQTDEGRQEAMKHQVYVDRLNRIDTYVESLDLEVSVQGFLMIHIRDNWREILNVLTA